jgi:hypothetical protein
MAVIAVLYSIGLVCNYEKLKIKPQGVNMFFNKNER